MITKYTNFWKFIKDIQNIKNAIILVPEHFKYEMNELNTDNYKHIMGILKNNNIKVMEMRNNVRNNFKAK